MKRFHDGWASRAAAAAAVMVVYASACGGSSSGGSSSGGAGGAGGAACSDEIEGVDCECNGELYAPSCVNGEIECDPCPDPEPECGPGLPSCPAGMYCAFDDMVCGDAGGLGFCVEAEPLTDCPYVYLGERCGCDGQLRANECVTHQSGVDLDESGGCVLGADQFSCGSSACAVGKQWCNVKEHVCIGEPPCEPMNCACLATTHPGCACTAETSGAVFLNCP